jgi:hypothetical protein
MPKEFAPGIPKREISPIREIDREGPNEVWPFAAQLHQAKKAGDHIDLRLTDPQTGEAHSWAIPRGALPSPGEKVLAVPQPTHTAEYAARKGKWEIPAGYGAGKVVAKRVEPAEVILSDNRRIKFNLYGPGQSVEEYSIIKTKKGDLLVNHTPQGRRIGGIKGYTVPATRPKYKEAPFTKVDTEDPQELMQAKIDGAHVLVGLQSGKPARVFSYRTPKKRDLIEHTHRVPDWNKRVVPAGLGGTILRAELWGEDQTGKAISSEQLAGMLNTNVWNSRDKQEDKNVKLRVSGFDVVQHKGREAENLSYEKKLQILQRAADRLPWLDMPPMARSPEEKKKLLKNIQAGKVPETTEGVVTWRLDKPAPPVKAKITPEYDGKIVGATQGRGKYEDRGIGAFLVKDESTGTVNRVGTGLKDKLRRAALKFPELFKGLVVKLKGQGQFPSGKIRAPRMSEFHLDKNDPARLEQIRKYAAFFDELRKLNGF